MTDEALPQTHERALVNGSEFTVRVPAAAQRAVKHALSVLLL